MENKRIQLAIGDKIVKGTITHSLYQTAVDQKLPSNTLIELIRIFSFDVDFQREVQRGDRFSLLFDVYRNRKNKVVHNGKIKWASMTLSGKKFEYAAYKNKNGFTDYYDRKGKSVKKTLMRTPIDGARLSSRYGKRRHPILGYSKMHKGVDFAAPKGYKIRAADAGKIIVAGKKKRYRGYGKVTVIDHGRRRKDGKRVSTLYAHQSRILIKVGDVVKKGDEIGWVGATGYATGPHLHFEMRLDGKPTNPMKFFKKSYL